MNNHTPAPIKFDPNFKRATVVVTNLKTGKQVMMMKDFPMNADAAIEAFQYDIAAQAVEMSHCVISPAVTKCYDKTL
jgi:hypothetical protein